MHNLICLSYPSLLCLEAVARMHAVGATYVWKETNKYKRPTNTIAIHLQRLLYSGCVYFGQYEKSGFTAAVVLDANLFFQKKFVY